MNVNVCPVCNSQDVEIDTVIKWEPSAGIQRMNCNYCGYSGAMTSLNKEDADKLTVEKPKPQNQK